MAERAAAQRGRQTSRSQARGRERRAALLRAAGELLHDHDFTDISLQDVARAAGIPAASAYHFFSDSLDAFASLAEVIGGELAERLAPPVAPSEVSSWEDILRVCISRTTDFYGERPDAIQLLIGTHTPAAFKLSDRQNDEILASIVRGHIESAFELPSIPQFDRIMFYSLEIIDLMYSLSVLRDGRITSEMADEAMRAGVAYLRTYLPSVLSPKTISPS